MHKIHEQSAVLFDNTVAISENLQALYDDTNTHNENLIKVDQLLGSVNGYFDDAGTPVTIPQVKAAIESTCGPGSTRRALEAEDGVGELLLESQQEMSTKLDRMEAKLEQQQEENRAMRAKLEEQTEMLKQLLSRLAGDAGE